MHYCIKCVHALLGFSVKTPVDPTTFPVTALKGVCDRENRYLMVDLDTTCLAGMVARESVPYGRSPYNMSSRHGDERIGALR